MTETFHRRLDQIVVEAGLVTRRQIDQLLSARNGPEKRLSHLLVEKGLVSEEDLHALIEEKLKISRVNLNDYPVDYQAADTIPAELAIRHRVVPIKRKNGRLLLAMADPLDLAAIDDVSMYCQVEVVPVLAGGRAIDQLITQFYSLRSQQDEADRPVKKKSHIPGGGTTAVLDEHDSSAAPVIRLVDSLIERAVAEGASDIHLEPEAERLRIRLRYDGVLHDLPSPPGINRAHIISRIKIMANLDIAERRLPQDGNIEWRNKKSRASMRISTLPTVHGEKVVIRLLEKERIVLPLDQLGFSGNNYNALLHLLLNQHGMILVTGPTGSGKTTTLYSAINYLNQPACNIVTVEDPVEFQLGGINQVQVNPRIGRTFASTLRSILRQDPDIIMVGEIRDLETAKITSQAAMTGHLVLSTLHTNNAAAAVTRLVDMGLEDYLVSASLVGVIAQRLVRIICPHCLVEYKPNLEEQQLYKRFFKQEAPQKLYRGKKCKRCNMTGYRGRSSIQEILVINQALQELIMAGVTAEQLQQKAEQLGMKTLLEDGLRLVEAGKTTVNEIIRTTFSSIFDNRLAGSCDSLAYLNCLGRERQ